MPKREKRKRDTRTHARRIHCRSDFEKRTRTDVTPNPVQYYYYYSNKALLFHWTQCFPPRTIQVCPEIRPEPTRASACVNRQTWIQPSRLESYENNSCIFHIVANIASWFFLNSRVWLHVGLITLYMNPISFWIRSQGLGSDWNGCVRKMGSRRTTYIYTHM